MALTLGTGPLGQAPAGVFNRELDRDGLLFLEPFPRRIRGTAAGETVVDSRAAGMLFEHGRLPIHLFPRDEVRADLLVPGETTSGAPNKGPARRFHLRVDSDVRENAAWEWHAPPPGAPPLAGLVAFEFGALDHWYEEDEELFVHPRDPYHRVDALATSRRVRVSLDGETLAETDRGTVIFETGLPPRWYFPPEDVTAELIASETRTGCAYKGFAEYHSVRVGGRVEEDVVWRYGEPHRDVAPIAGMLAFFNERVDIDLDGERQERPLTPWSPDWPGEREEDAGPPVIRPDR
jgi:uncharacterized protein (DUF427 family)